MFPMGGHYLIALDFRGPDKDEIRLSLAEKSMESVGALFRVFRRFYHPTNHDVEARSAQETCESVEIEEKLRSECATLPPSHALPTRATDKHVTFIHDSSMVTPSEVERLSSISASISATGPDDIPSTKETPAYPPPQNSSRRHFKKFLHFIQTLLTVPTMAVIIALIIAVVQPLKALFVLLPSSPHAPDGQPPLAFIMDTATFLGGASVPLGLICLGSAMARLHIPRSNWRALPLGSIVSLALGRMVLQPVLGVLIVQGLTHVGIISAEDKVLRFVCMRVMILNILFDV
jgi:auxin efflux carrier family protein